MNPPLNVIADKIRQAEKIVVGASNGLSIAEGIHIFADNADFHAHFGDFSQKYGFRSMIHGCFYPFPSQESYWAYFARLYHYMNVQKPAGKVMADLRNILKNKDYFVVTSNFDNHFRQAGFAEERLFEIEGVGTHNQLIKLPFMQQVYARDNAFYITVNKGEIYIPPEIAPRSLGVANGLTEWLEQLNAEFA
ncbi:hypothetical protein CRG49_008430 [Neisseria sp. N95_16]|uniref:Uncharacterized protein n=1 Tax=Neisseria brasiliensis TaxID=2666100 RepID=A0A5Q3S182_9NEIS|nr:MULTISPECIES: hypothetical protein [Neisseria]MRN37572.1 hypothetical protein [Neisseria brasiliensis]PJO09280.1 hypothetical protein CRG49_008430 [Neisseria sp. N95_16]PJO79302.1 hypothetical protein CWC45_00090 [Neisseria sp. N177_16]QGL24558.1 hypothetical protein GJV52_02830 [Neisseria brasiliensis]